MSIKKRLIVVVGATGSGKTDLSIELARHYNTEIISTDSRQIFVGMPIGTAQPTREQLESVRHHFIASHKITEHYTCGRYETEALACLRHLFISHDIVVAVGGSGLYIDALCNGMDIMPDIDPLLRKELTDMLNNNGIELLLERLKELDPEFYEQVDQSNPKRVMRAMEVCMQTGLKYSTLRSGKIAERDFEIIKIGTSIPREELYERINRRVDLMIEAGLEHEAHSLHMHKELNSLQTVGYRELFDYFDNRCNRDEAIELIKRNSRRYAKRQTTWFGRDLSIEWFAPLQIEQIIDYIDKK